MTTFQTENCYRENYFWLEQKFYSGNAFKYFFRKYNQTNFHIARFRLTHGPTKNCSVVFRLIDCGNC